MVLEALRNPRFLTILAEGNTINRILHNKGNPYFIEFRPLLHSPYKLTEAEAKKLKKETPVLRMDVAAGNVREQNKAPKASAKKAKRKKR